MPIIDAIASLSGIEKVEGKSGAELAKEIMVAANDKI